MSIVKKLLPKKAMDYKTKYLIIIILISNLQYFVG